MLVLADTAYGINTEAAERSPPETVAEHDPIDESRPLIVFETRAGTSRDGDDCAGVDHHTAPGG